LRVLIAVTHLLGAGHLTRAAALARAFARKGHETMLVSGGSPVRLSDLANVTFVQLPSVRTIGTDFRTLLGEDFEPVDAAYLERRRTLLLQALKAVRPDILITELFPFGRRVLADEFSALLDAARRSSPRPLVLCSIRDILVPSSKASRIAEAHERALRDYDAVLVHGDPDLLPLEASWPVDERIKPLIHYTGYVDENDGPVPASRRHGILISGGSSAASLPLFRTALAASREITDRPWRILIGRGVAEPDFLALQEGAPAHVVVERARPDFRALLAGAELSVSQAGYNTTIDLLRCRVRSVLVPFEAGHETEQRLRAERLTALGLAEILPEADLSWQNLANAIRRGLTRAPSPAPSISIDGARRSVVVAESLAHSRPALHRTTDWSPLDRALDRAEDQGYPVRFWWRDDDAVADTPQLDRLLGLARRLDVGIGLAVIPEGIDASLAMRLADEPKAVALVHGWSHANHAPAGDKKAEFGPHRPLELMVAEAEQALNAAREHLGSRLLPVFVPPWNRISPEIVAHLPHLGFRGLSTFMDRKAVHPVTGLVQINTHVDPIDWHGTRSLADPALIVANLASAIERRSAGRADRDEPIGLLTHHLVHDEVIWSLCERLIAHLAARGIRFMCPDECFGMETKLHLRSNGI
jgi:predicted glycosyltransferase